MGNVAVTVEKCVKRCGDSFVKRRHEEHTMRLFCLNPMETLQVKEALIPIQR